MSDMVPPLPGMTADEDDAVRDAMNDVLRHVADWDFEQLSAGFRAVERQFADRFAGRPEARRSLRRMVAQSIHMMSNEKALPVDVSQRLLDEAMALGWDQLYEKVAHVAAFARLCLAQGRPEPAAAYLVPLIDEVEHVEHLGRDEHLALLRQMLEELRGAP